jgi:hypothetical protein
VGGKNLEGLETTSRNNLLGVSAHEKYTTNFIPRNFCFNSSTMGKNRGKNASKVTTSKQPSHGWGRLFHLWIFGKKLSNLPYI